ncbi:hypothetical protein WR25_17887 [Diploscapter pachys]|uniref:Uncharacterized protein n=1 Tax=Diploscapter pachys TaxID=2018661 RepID=A0A2A2JZH7_9BILA|nr:hypothetical protein WR25_17887 [Diploscapter pachys]
MAAKCTGSIPSLSIIGINIGVARRMALTSSMNIPTNSRKRLTSSIKMSGFSLMVVNPSKSNCGTLCMVNMRDNIDAKKTKTNNTPVICPAFQSVVYKSFQPNSR